MARLVPRRDSRGRHDQHPDEPCLGRRGVTRASEEGSARTSGRTTAGTAAASDAAASFESVLLADAPTIGEGIRRERLRRGLTLAQLATQVHLTVSALSQIERGASDPSISSLRRIAHAFGTPMFQFLVGTDRPEVVVRRNRRTRLTFPDRELEYELISADT